jgi:hypothetical protein
MVHLRLTDVDEAINEVIQVIAYVNDINRIAEAVGVGLEPEWEER